MTEFRMTFLGKVVVMCFIFLGPQAPSVARAAIPEVIERSIKQQPQSDMAVLLVDLQECFVQGGSLAVPDADEKFINQVHSALRWLSKKRLLLLASRDYHPEGHASFASAHAGTEPYQMIQLPDGRSQMLWPDHCVQTRGDSRLVIDNNLFFETIKKGQDPEYDSNSAFEDDGGHKTELNMLLRRHGVNTLIVFGLATEVCVMSTIRHAVAEGYRVVFVEELSRGLSAEGVKRALEEMNDLGVEMVSGVSGLRGFVSHYLASSPSKG